MRDETPSWRGPALLAALVGLPVAAFAALRPGPFTATVQSPAALLRIGILALAMTLLSRGLRRVVDSAALRAAVLALPALAVLGLIVAPYFRDETVVEALPATVADLAGETGSAVPTTVAGPGPAPTTTAAPAPAPVPPVASTAVPAPVATAPPPAPVTTAPPASAGPVKVTTGTLRGIDHRASGEAALYRLADGTAFVRLEGIDVQTGPDYVLYLVPGADRERPDDGISLGDLKGNQGSQNYALPAGVDLDARWTVLIWCRAFSVPIANATQQPV